LILRIDLRELPRIGILAFVAEEIARRQSAPVRPVDGVRIPVAPLGEIEQPPPADLVLQPVIVAALDDQLAVDAGVVQLRRAAHGIGDARRQADRAADGADAAAGLEGGVLGRLGHLLFVRCPLLEGPVTHRGLVRHAKRTRDQGLRTKDQLR